MRVGSTRRLIPHQVRRDTVSSIQSAVGEGTLVYWNGRVLDGIACPLPSTDSREDPLDRCRPVCHPRRGMRVGLGHSQVGFDHGLQRSDVLADAPPDGLVRALRGEPLDEVEPRR